ncbi:SOS response-associated peptidase [Aequorivita capsosiphonis]|uniref:SOS response-associated peptidase n=1 Tax=Aequorivita capsosiphonis TaxID=487317 RepID=UPI000401C905|nr:SOS response-associated peptidase [Aequorivita capsosiphonis]
MCYRTKLNSSKKEIESEFDVAFIDPENYESREEINGFSFSKTPVITNENPGEIQLFNWGLIPFWAKDDAIKKMTLNSRIETASEKPAFRNSVDNRCLIIADGYYEWKWLDPKGKEKHKYLIEPNDQNIFGFAGFYSEWKDPKTGDLINSYTIATTDANELMQEIHNNKKRMPIILKNSDRMSWLRGDALKNFEFPYDVELVAKAI